jgi:two-component system, OmpR family, phosphate regulon response regulator OmpR
MSTSTSPAAGGRREPLPDNAPHILLVDDDQRILDLLARVLNDNGFRVTPAADVPAARSAMRSLAFDLVLLDRMMPGISGIEFARELKTQFPLPICMLTASSETEERIEGLEAGVDDYITKPFEPRELILRIKNILRRGRPAPGPADEIRMGEMVFHIGRGELRRGDEAIKLTERERDMLRQFASRAGLPIARHELATDDATGSERSIDVQINRLRIESNPSNPVYLQTARGKGYVLFTD